MLSGILLFLTLSTDCHNSLIDYTVHKCALFLLSSVLSLVRSASVEAQIHNRRFDYILFIVTETTGASPAVRLYATQ